MLCECIISFKGVLKPMFTISNAYRCCLGAAFEPRYHPKFITYPKSVADFFADRAKALLDIELDSPTLATVQAMVVLSGHDIGCKRDARGWLYSGQYDQDIRWALKFLTSFPRNGHATRF